MNVNVIGHAVSFGWVIHTFVNSYGLANLGIGIRKTS